MNHNVIRMHNSSGSIRPLRQWLRALAVVPLFCLFLTVPAALSGTQEEPADTADSSAAALVSINSADAETLAGALLGIGQSKAQAIVEWREANGSFTSIDQLTEVKGVGQATVDKNRHKLSL